LREIEPGKVRDLSSSSGRRETLENRNTEPVPRDELAPEACAYVTIGIHLAALKADPGRDHCAEEPLIHACSREEVELRHRAIEVVEALKRTDRVKIIGIGIRMKRKLLAIVARRAIGAGVADLVSQSGGGELVMVLEVPNEDTAREQ